MTVAKVNNNGKVFISYKRTADAFVARAIMMDLRANDYEVFLDTENIDSGKFENVILNELGLRDNFVVIVSEYWAKAVLDEADWCRRELERVIELKRNVVPILVGGFRYQDDSDNPVLARLSQFSSLTLLPDYFDSAMQKLRDRFLKQPTLQELEIMTAEEYFQKGETFLRNENYKEAVDVYTKAVELNPKLPEAFCNRAVAKYALRDLEGAIKDLDQAILLDPGGSELYKNKGDILQELGRMKEAIDTYRQMFGGKGRKTEGVDLSDPNTWSEFNLY